MDYQFSIDFGNGLEVVPQPLNHAAIKLELIFNSPTPSAAIQSVNFEWLGDTAAKINNYVAEGLTGGAGIYQGLPLRIQACNVNVGFDLILDLVNANTTVECDRVVCSVRDVGNVDWLSQVAGAFGFWYLASPQYTIQNDPAYNQLAVITNKDYKVTPYCISQIPDYINATLSALGTLSAVYQLANQIEKLEKDVEHIVEFGGALSVGGVITSIADMVIDIAGIALSVIQITTLAESMVNNILQPVKYKYCMREVDLFTKMCAHLHLNFASSIYSYNKPSGYNNAYDNATWMPRKIVLLENKTLFQTFLQTDALQRDANEINSPDSYGYFDGTCQDFLKAMSDKYNARPVITSDGTLHFEEVHYWNKNTIPYKIPNTDVPGYPFNFPQPSGTNAMELPPSYLLEFQTDQTDLNTLQNYNGTNANIILVPKVLNNIRHIIQGAGVTFTLPCALASRKTFLTDAENGIISLVDGLNNTITGFNNTVISTLNDLLKGIRAVVKVITFGAVKVPLIPNIDTIDISIDERIGWMQLSGDSFDIPKSFIGVEQNGYWYIKLYTNDANGNEWNSVKSTGAMTAIALANDFHWLNMASRGNQWLTYSGKTFPFCCGDFQQVLDNNIFITPNGVLGKFTKLLWELETEKATDTDYRVNQPFTNNFTEQITIDGVVQ